MIVHDSDQPIYFDVDNTLIEYEKGPHELGYSRELLKFNCYGHNTLAYAHLGHIKFLKTSKARGRMIVVWSQQGARWAEEVIKVLGLEEYVDVVLTKPIAYVDDLPAQAFMTDHIFFKKGY